jgi:cytochrome c-type biogenesis protein CcmE
MEPFKIMILIIVALAFSILMYSLTFNLWFFRKEESIKGDKDFVIYSILKIAYECYDKNLNLKGSVICGKIQISSNEDISKEEILSRLDKRRIEENKFFVESLRKNSKVIIRYENGNIFIEEEKYESISS